jgi:ABC-type Co2+ transport system permease subunit
MHIEPGFVSAAKIVLANGAALALLGSQAMKLVKAPQLLARSAVAAVFFTVFMQMFHLPVGPSELHFVGAMSIYLTLGFVPTLFGFAAGLLLQGMLFAPADLAHLGVNLLSLAAPLVVVHRLWGEKLARLDAKAIYKLDAAYYSGVTLMVGFWLSMSEVATPLSAWAAFAASYLAIVAIEPLVTLLAVRGLRSHAGSRWAALCFDLKAARLA